MQTPKKRNKLRTYSPWALALGTLASSSAASAQGDPVGGKFTIEEAVKGLPGSDKLKALIKTSQGDFRCELFEKEAPSTVANFVGLARGLRPFLDPASDQWVRRNFYEGLTFHRVIPGFMIQGGDLKGDGSGEPGYTINDEKNGLHKFDHGGVLAMANRGPNTGGSQFFVTEGPSHELDDGARPGVHYQIFGECGPTELVRRIARLPRDDRDRPNTDVKILTVTIQRGEFSTVPRLRQFQGKVTVALTWALIAARKSTGATWDGTAVPNAALEEEARQPLPRSTTMRLFREMSRGSDPKAWLAKRLPWTVDGFVLGDHAPDIAVELTLDGQPLGRADKVEDSYTPHWDAKFSQPVELTAQSVIKLKFLDVDALSKEDVGTCELTGAPWVDDNGLVDPGSYNCDSQIWALGVRVVPVDSSVPVNFRKVEPPHPGTREAEKAGAE